AACFAGADSLINLTPHGICRRSCERRDARGRLYLSGNNDGFFQVLCLFFDRLTVFEPQLSLRKARFRLGHQR
ncbi:MAG: hypothetical protein KJO15_05005, partial [Alphaproteobacteria bacterium]|nr:hypothetical protein [Alphaproteobacteria bacterium]